MGHYEKLVSAVPINSNAANAIKGGISFDESNVAKIPDQVGYWENQPPLEPVSSLKFMSMNPHFKDFTGVKYGRLTVIGMLLNKNRSKSASATWVVKCSCGYYEARKARTIKARNSTDKCRRCMNIDSMKLRSSGIVGKALNP